MSTKSDPKILLGKLSTTIGDVSHDHSLPSIIFCEAVAIYGIIIAIILCQRYNTNPPADYMSEIGRFTYDRMLFCGYSIFWTGVLIGFSNIACGYVSHQICANLTHFV